MSISEEASQLVKTYYDIVDFNLSGMYDVKMKTAKLGALKNVSDRINENKKYKTENNVPDNVDFNIECLEKLKIEINKI